MKELGGPALAAMSLAWSMSWTASFELVARLRVNLLAVASILSITWLPFSEK